MPVFQKLLIFCDDKSGNGDNIVELETHESSTLTRCKPRLFFWRVLMKFVSHANKLSLSANFPIIKKRSITINVITRKRYFHSFTIFIRYRKSMHARRQLFSISQKINEPKNLMRKVCKLKTFFFFI